MNLSQDGFCTVSASTFANTKFKGPHHLPTQQEADLVYVLDKIGAASAKVSLIGSETAKFNYKFCKANDD